MCLRDSKTLMPYVYVDATSIICTVSSNVGPGRYAVSVIRRSEAGVQSNMLYFYSSTSPLPPSPAPTALPSQTGVPSHSIMPSAVPTPSPRPGPIMPSASAVPTPSSFPRPSPTYAPLPTSSSAPVVRTSVTPVKASATPPASHNSGGGGGGKVVVIAVVIILLVVVGGGAGWWMFKRRAGAPSSSAPSKKPSLGPKAYGANGDGSGAGPDDATEMGILQVVPAAAVAGASHTQASSSGDGLVLKKKPYVDPQTFEVSWESFTHSQVKTFVIASQDNLDGRLEAACIRTIASGVVESVRRAYFCAIDQNSGAIFLLQLTIDITTGDCNALVKSDNKDALAKFVPVLARAIDM